MMLKYVLGAVLLAFSASVDAGKMVPIKFAEYAIRNPAFCKLMNNSLFVTGFTVFKSDGVYIIRNINDKTNRAVNQLSKVPVWPNNIENVPESTFDIPVVSIGSGFLVPGKKNGGVFMIRTDVPNQQFNIAPKENGWSYHKAVMVDADGDGDLDVITARFHKPFIGSVKSHLLWLENPGGKTSYKQRWQMHKMMDGPGVHFDYKPNHMIGKTKYSVIATAEYWQQKVQLLWTKGSWSDMSNVKSRVIDSTLGKAFDVRIIDLNKDGVDDVLVTYNAPKNGTVYAYEFENNDYSTSPFRRHILGANYNQIKSSWQPGMGAPGSAKTFYPTTDMKGKPWIMMSGDDDGRVYTLAPRSEDPKDWRYEQSYFVDEGDTVGEMTIGDVNKDGNSEVYIPSYGKNKVLAFEFRPQK